MVGMADTNKPITYVVLSYFPLLAGRAGETVDLETGEIEALQAVMKDLPGGGAKCCLWVKGEDGLRPVLVFKDADAVHDHMVTWAENDPTKWFRLTVLQKDGKYLIGLAPDIGKSIERFKIARQLKTGFPVPEDSQFNILFQPLHFVSGSDNMFELIKNELSDEVSIGFMDASLLNVDDPESMDPNRIRWVGPFPRASEGLMDDYYGSIIDGAEEPTERPILFDGDGKSVP